MRKLSIEIKGSAASGKSTLAFLIKHTLKKYKVNCVISGSEDEIPGALEKSWETR